MSTQPGEIACAVRVATVADAATIAHHRAAMFVDMGILAPARAPALRAATVEYLRSALPEGRYRGWLAEIAGTVAGGAGLVTYTTLPRPENLQGGEDAYVFNVYTEPAERGRGVASRLMVVILDWCRARGIACVNLHASEAGRPIYERLGFEPTREMRLFLAHSA
jgi:GNAT superfamily N-acetyltransferase